MTGRSRPGLSGPTWAEVDRRLPAARAVLAQATMELRLLVRSGESLLVTFGIPLGLLAFLSTVNVLPTGDRAAVDLLAPGVLALSTAATGLVAVAIQTAFERKYGVLKRLGGTPLPRWGFLAAKGLAVAVLVAAQGILTATVAVGLLGWRPSGGGAAALVAVVILVLGAATHTTIGLLLAGTLRAEGTLAVSNALFVVLLVISGVAFDVGALPDALATIGRVLPLGALAEALRTAVDGGLPITSTALVAGWGVLAAAVAARAFRWEP